MIAINRLCTMLMDVRADVNNKLDSSTIERRIDHIVVSATEPHMVKKLKDKPGVILAVKMPEADTDINSIDNIRENNHMLIYVIEKVDPGTLSDQIEREHYSDLQEIMRLVKEWIAERGINGNVCGGDETLSNKKAYHTEWEYGTFGGFNGLSISFDLIDFSL